MGVGKGIKIGFKLAFLIVVMLIGIMCVGFTGFYYNTKSNLALDDLYTQNIIAIEKLGDARTQTRANFANILNLMVTVDEAGRQKILDDYNKRLNTIDKDLTEFSQLSLDDYETQQYQLIQTNRNTWYEDANKIIDSMKQGKVEDAVSIFKATGETNFETLQTSIRDLLNYNNKEAEDTFNENKLNGQTAIKQLIAAIIISFVLCILLGVLITMSITKPIHRVVSLIKKTSELDFTYDKSCEALLGKKDEVGIITDSIAHLRAVLREATGRIYEVSEQLATNSNVLAASTEENAKTIHQVVTAINEIAQGNSAQAEMIEKTSETVVAMASNINEVNKATVVNSESAKASMAMVEEGQRAIDDTTRKMKDNKKVTNQVGQAINELSVQIDKVGSIISVISEISEQTNLLSLNASIEAARAGEAGKGFAVVASEIGKLAKQTAEAVEEITGIISDTIAKNEATAENNKAAQSITQEQEKSLEIMTEAFHKIKSSVEDMALRTEKIAHRVSEIDASSKKIADQTQDISAVAEESAAGSQEISASNEEQLASMEHIASSAGDLSSMATKLSQEISKFKL